MKILKANKQIKNKFSSIKRSFFKRKSYLKAWWHTKHIYGLKHIEREKLDCIVICVVRDAENYIDKFIQYYLNKGFKHIIFMDNGSTDRTIEIASQYDRITILHCLLPFAKNKYNMLQYMIYKYSFNSWCLIADCDEFFDFPYSNKISLKQFIQYLEKNQYTAVLNQMLDMYPNEPIHPEQKNHGNMESHCWFEINTIQKQEISPGFENDIDCSLLKLHYGGVRKRIFNVLPLISKFPLLKPDRQLFIIGPVTPHLVSWAKVADLSCVLYHYKFLGNFYKEVRKAVDRKQYYQGSIEYKGYHETLQKNQSLYLYSEQHSIKLQDTEQLVSLDFLKVGQQYKNYVLANQNL